LIDALGASLAVERALSLIGAHVKAIVPCDCIAVYLIEDGMLVPHHVSGTDETLFRSIRIPLGEGVSGWVADTQRSVVNGNPSVEPGYMHNPAKFSILLSVTSIPLIGASGILGVLSLYSRSRDSFTADHIRLLNAVAAKVAIAVERVGELNRTRGAALIDSETHTANTGALLVHLEAQLSRCSDAGESLAVLILSLDGLKQVAEHRGPMVADTLAARIADGLRYSCSEYDLVAHLRTEELVVALTGSDQAAVRQRASQFLQAAQDAALAAAGDGMLSITAGTAIWPTDGTTPETLLAAADRDVYTSRRALTNANGAPATPRVWPSDTMNESVVSCP
jgi:diguanylate cyclase (GGDEF)-like protein